MTEMAQLPRRRPGYGLKPTGMLLKLKQKNWFLSNIQLPYLATNRNGENNSAIVEEISSFSVCWDEMVTQTLISARTTATEKKSSTDASSYKKVRNILLAICCTDKSV